VAHRSNYISDVEAKASTFNDSDLGINVTPDITTGPTTFTSIPVFTLVPVKTARALLETPSPGPKLCRGRREEQLEVWCWILALQQNLSYGYY